MRLKITKVNINNESHLQEILGVAGLKDYGKSIDLCDFVTFPIHDSDLDQEQKSVFASMLQVLVNNGFGVEVLQS